MQKTQLGIEILSDRQNFNTHLHICKLKVCKLDKIFIFIAYRHENMNYVRGLTLHNFSSKTTKHSAAYHKNSSSYANASDQAAHKEVVWVWSALFSLTFLF